MFSHFSERERENLFAKYQTYNVHKITYNGGEAYAYLRGPPMTKIIITICNKKQQNTKQQSARCMCKQNK